MAAPRRGRPAVPGLRVGEVDGEGRDALEPLQGRHRARAGDDVRSLGGELAGHGEPDALARAGDDATLPVSSRSMGGRYRSTADIPASS